MKIVEKPWGEELWIEVNERYAFKMIRYKKGCRTSLQYHRRKHETIYVEEGRIGIDAGKEQRIYVQGDVIINEPNRRHRVEALEDSRVFEVSTPEVDDVVRLEDDFGRK